MDEKLPQTCSLIEHPDNLFNIKFPEVTENIPSDASVEFMKWNLTRAPVALKLATVVEKQIEVPI